MRVDIYTKPSCFDDLAAEWHELLASAAINHVFITPEFQKSWWITLDGGDLQVITVRTDQGQLVGIAPLYRFLNDDGKLQLSFVGCVNVSDYLDFIVHKEFKEIAYQEIIDYLKRSISGWQEMFLCSIPEASPTLTLFQQQAQKEDWNRVQTQQDVCPIITLPSTWDEYLISLGKKQRHEIKRKWDKLFRETTAEFELVQGGDELGVAVKNFIELHQKSSEEKKNFWDDKHVAFFANFATAAAEKKWLYLYFLKISGKRVATMLGFEYENQFFLYNSGFDVEEFKSLSIGNVLTAYTIQQAIERGNVRYDFLRGDEEYKFRFRAVAEPVYDLKITKE